jgi:hypothetical protein
MDQSLSLTCINYILNVHKVGLNSTRFLIDRVRVLLLQEGSKETSSEQHEYKGYQNPSSIKSVYEHSNL